MGATSLSDLDLRKSGDRQVCVLVVEDEPSVGNLFECLLRKLGYEVLRAEHGEEAERAIASRKESPIDLVLTDLDMPLTSEQIWRRIENARRQRGCTGVMPALVAGIHV